MFKVGDKVQVKGFTGDWNEAVCRIVAVSPGSDHPYSIIAIDGKSSILGHTGRFSDRYLHRVDGPKASKKSDFSLDILARSRFDVIEFELLRASTSEYWAYTATHYTGRVSKEMEYHVTDTEGAPVGNVHLQYSPKAGMRWHYSDGPAGTIEGTAKTLEGALLKLTRTACMQ